MKNTIHPYKQYFKDYARPMIIRSVLTNIMFTADRLIAALFIGAGALVAATTLISPLMFLLSALASLFISGLGAYVGFLIGRNKIDKANRLSSGIIIIMGLLGLSMTIPSILFSTRLSQFLGARGDIFILAESYLRIFALAFPLLLVGKGLDVLILNDDSPKYSFILNIIVTLSNLLLNIIAVAILDWGIEGLAWATVISSAIELSGGLIYFLFKAKLLHLKRPAFEKRNIIRILYNGLSDFAMMLVEAVMVFIINMAFIRFLTPEHFEAYASVSIIITIFYSIYMGAAMGLQQVLSQLMGKKEYDSLKKILNYSVKKTLIYGFAAYIALIPFISTLLGLFINDPETIKFGIFFYLTMGFATIFSNYPLQTSLFYTSINRPMESSVISILRTLILIPILTFLFVKYFHATGVAAALVLTDLFLMILIHKFVKKQDLSELKIYE